MICLTALRKTHEVKRGKGYPDVYELAAARCQTDTAHCIVFEDILKAVQGAKDGGFYTVAVYDAASAQEQEEIKKICVTDISMITRNWSRNAEEVFII